MYEEAVARHKQAQEQREKAAALAEQIAQQAQDDGPGSPINIQGDDDKGASLQIDALN